MRSYFHSCDYEELNDAFLPRVSISQTVSFNDVHGCGSHFVNQVTQHDVTVYLAVH